MSNNHDQRGPGKPFTPHGPDDPNEYPPGWDYDRIKRIIDYYEPEARGEAVVDAEYLDLEDPAEEAAERRLDVLNIASDLDMARDQLELLSPEWTDEADRRDAARMIADLRWAVERCRAIAERQGVAATVPAPTAVENEGVVG